MAGVRHCASEDLFNRCVRGLFSRSAARQSSLNRSASTMAIILLVGCGLGKAGRRPVLNDAESKVRIRWDNPPGHNLRQIDQARQ